MKKKMVQKNKHAFLDPGVVDFPAPRPSWPKISSGREIAYFQP
jgi:hypothetical protein